jgi:hypothetical protein
MLERRGVIEQADDLILLPDDLAERELALPNSPLPRSAASCPPASIVATGPCRPSRCEDAPEWR